MLVFVDESGDSGIKGKAGSSALFVVSAVVFQDRDEATACDLAINDLRRELGRSEAFEFHFSKCGDADREAFLRKVANFRFLYFALVLEKRKLISEGVRDKDSFYKYTMNLVFENAKPFLSNAIVIMDESGNRDFRGQLGRYLKTHTNDDNSVATIKKVKMQRSSGNNLIQLADMVCGAVARSFRKGDRKANMRFRALIRDNEKSVQKWPN